MQERREIEAALHDGDLWAVAATNALELGVDVGSLDVTLHLGFPGKLVAFPSYCLCCLLFCHLSCLGVTFHLGFPVVLLAFPSYFLAYLCCLLFCHLPCLSVTLHLGSPGVLVASPSYGPAAFVPCYNVDVGPTVLPPFLPTTLSLLPIVQSTVLPPFLVLVFCLCCLLLAA